MYAVMKLGCAIGHFSRMAEKLPSAFRWRLTSVHSSWSIFVMVSSRPGTRGVPAFGTDVTARILKPVSEVEGRVGQRRDAARFDLAVVQRLLVAPAAEFAEAQLPTGHAVRAGDNRAERRAQRHVDVGSGGAPVVTDPRTAVEDEHDVIAAMAMPSHHHARVVVHIRREEVGPHDRPLLPHDGHGAVRVPLLLHGRPVGVVEVPKSRFDALDIRKGGAHALNVALLLTGVLLTVGWVWVLVVRLSVGAGVRPPNPISYCG